MPIYRAAITGLAAASLSLLSSAQTITPTPAKDREEAIAIFKQLIEINTTDTPLGNVTTGTSAMQKRFLDAGFAPEDVKLLGPNDRKQNLVVRIHGSGGTSSTKPILFLCHMDVVEALPKDWHTNPFEFVEKDNYYYGRGTQDMKEGDAALVSTFLRLHREGYKPSRDLILALTADEEGGASNGASWLVEHHRDLVDAAFVINPDSGGIEFEHGKPLVADVEATEKVYADYQITALNPGGHSSLPRKDNAIYELTSALNKLAVYSFPFELNGVTRAYFEALEKHEPEKAADLRAILKTPPDTAAAARLSEDPAFNSTFRTTCVATRLNAGHANNALPQTAQANVNCRIFPGHSPEQIRQQLIQLFGDQKLTVRYVSDAGEVSDTAPERKAIVPPPPSPEVFDPLRKLVDQIWPGTDVTPIMEDGASDSIYFAQAGIPCYGFSGIALERDDVRAHGQDERLPVSSYDKSIQFFYAFTKAIGSH